MDFTSDKDDIRQIITYLKALEARVARLENRVSSLPEGKEEEISMPPLLPGNVAQRVESLELHIGEFWLSKAGIVVLIIGLAFLLSLPYEKISASLVAGLGYLIIAGLFGLSHYWRDTYQNLSKYLLGGALILLFYTTMRLHFLTSKIFIHSKTIAVSLLVVVTLASLLISLRRKSVYLTAISLLMGYFSALLSNSPYFIFTIIIFLAVIAVNCQRRYGWRNILIFSIIVTYISHLIWFINNPIVSGKVEFVSSPAANVFFVLIYMVIFAIGNLLRNDAETEDTPLIISTFFNSFGGYGLYLMLTAFKFQEHLTLYHLVASALFLALAVAFWIREQSRYSTFFYAMLGYGALSVAIIAQFEKPDYFVWLCWQSLLVISTAIWFRSKFIILANFVIYVLLFLGFLILSEKSGFISLSFGVVALLSARILNWRKDRLELKTEFMRNAYLGTAFIIFPYAFYILVPSGYISLSWVGITILYYLMSKVLNNSKYRWLALLTLLLTVLRVMFIDITNLDPAYRVISFLVLGVVLLISSIIYAKIRKKSADNPQQI